jgi:hypothetical protein
MYLKTVFDRLHDFTTKYVVNKQTKNVLQINTDKKYYKARFIFHMCNKTRNVDSNYPILLTTGDAR